jgi:hypothetical protein
MNFLVYLKPSKHLLKTKPIIRLKVLKLTMEMSIVRKNLIVHLTPQENGAAERLNRTIMERAQSMLSNAGLGKEFWAEAVNTSMYLINRSH